jgi:hypothetical protein
MAYATAVAAYAGIKIDNVTHTDFGTDLIFQRLRKRWIDDHYSDVGAIKVPCQVKSARFPVWHESAKKDSIIYPLRAKNYNDLVESTCAILVLLCLPESLEKWVQQDFECLRLYKCCYWWRPKPDDELIESDTTKNIHIPCDQLFSAEYLASYIDNQQLRLES